MHLTKMTNFRCTSFNDVLWQYVVENARVRGVSRCRALELIVEEHIKFVKDAQDEWMEDQENVE